MDTNRIIDVTVRNNEHPDAHFRTIIPKPNMVDDVNTLTQEMVNQENTKYIIKYDYVLGGDIVIKPGCIIEFDGGSISNGTGSNYSLAGTATKVVNLYAYTVFQNISPTGIVTFTGSYE